MKYVRDQLLRGASLITKRILFDVSDAEREAVYLSLKHVLTTNDHGAVDIVSM